MDTLINGSDRTTKIFLMDNGSLEPASVLSLRAIAAALARKLGHEVEPLSLLHSSSILSQEINSQPAEIFEPAIEKRLRNGLSDFLIVPAFFGPSGALTDYLPRRVAALKTKYPQLRLRVAEPLVKTDALDDTRIAQILADRVRQVSTNFLQQSATTLPSKYSVVLVDHGSPLRQVTDVRDHVARQLRALLGDSVIQVVAASMERRPGPDYSFSDPLLEKALDQPNLKSGTVIVALLFISPGRHAGPNGDIAQICAAATTRHANLRPVVMAPIGPDDRLIEVLVDRTLAGLKRLPL